MDPDLLIPFIPIMFFVCVAYAIKAVADARTRAKLIAGNTSQDLIQAILLSDEESRRINSLRWGVVLSCMAGGLALIEWIGWEEPTAGMFAVLVGATGIGNLGFFAIAQLVRTRRRANERA